MNSTENGDEIIDVSKGDPKALVKFQGLFGEDILRMDS